MTRAASPDSSPSNDASAASVRAGHHLCQTQEPVCCHSLGRACQGPERRWLHDICSYPGKRTTPAPIPFRPLQTPSEGQTLPVPTSNLYPHLASSRRPRRTNTAPPPHHDDEHALMRPSPDTHRQMPVTACAWAIRDRSLSGSPTPRVPTPLPQIAAQPATALVRCDRPDSFFVGPRGEQRPRSATVLEGGRACRRALPRRRD